MAAAVPPVPPPTTKTSAFKTEDMTILDFRFENGERQILSVKPLKKMNTQIPKLLKKSDI